MQLAADGQVTVVNHDPEKNAVGCPKGKEEIPLGQASRGDGGVPAQVVQQHLTDGCGGKADAEKRQIAEEVRIREDGQDGEQGHQAPNQIQAAGQPEERLLLLGCSERPSRMNSETWIQLSTSGRSDTGSKGISCGRTPGQEGVTHCCPSHPAFLICYMELIILTS